MTLQRSSSPGGGSVTLQRSSSLGSGPLTTSPRIVAMLGSPVTGPAHMPTSPSFSLAPQSIMSLVGTQTSPCYLGSGQVSVGLNSCVTTSQSTPQQSPALGFRPEPLMVRSLSNASEEECESVRIGMIFEQQAAFVKTVKNHDWLELVHKLRRDTEFRTSASLPPPAAVGMHLFGEVSKGCTGLVWDRRELDLSSAHIWPSGYMAKTEHNMTSNGHLLRGRAEARVSLQTLMNQNLSRNYKRPYGDDFIHVEPGETMPFNEINWPVRGFSGIVALFVRSMEPEHVFFAVGVMSLFQHACGKLLPLFLVDSVNAARHLNHVELLEMLRRHRPDPRAVITPRLPLELQSFPEIPAMDRLMLHGNYGISARTLATVFEGISTWMDLAQELSVISVGLRGALATRNVASARELVRAFVPCFNSCRMAELEDSPSDGDAHVLHNFTVEVTQLAENLGPVDHDELLVAMAAMIVLCEFFTGMKRRLEHALEDVRECLEDSHSKWFAPQTWFKVLHHDPDLGIGAVISGRASANFADLTGRLEAMREASTLENYTRAIYDALEDQEMRPQRVRHLRHVIGLSNAFSEDVAHAAVCLAADAAARPAPWSPFSIDEATLLEAGAHGFLSPDEKPRVADPDPLGVRRRQNRAKYTYR
eukprot:TRINITY_DN42586_c0_g1_i1.p1 TRINITY_DN42586_c0_g1~~TRINITY_DN42586_c0_g1_i1.p1  ORF type:complete len:647 (-),score=59.88 TRINITY_DN42586_c0_g1_i1:330-2270(-)